MVIQHAGFERGGVPEHVQAARDEVHVVVGHATAMSNAEMLSHQVMLLHEVGSTAGDVLGKQVCSAKA